MEEAIKIIERYLNKQKEFIVNSQLDSWENDIQLEQTEKILNMLKDHQAKLHKQ